jgi:hypothetical protein
MDLHGIFGDNIGDLVIISHFEFDFGAF